MAVKCELCGREFRSITPMHVKSCSGITMDEYRSRFPFFPLTSDETLELKRAAGVALGKNPDVVRRRTNSLYDTWTTSKRLEQSYTMRQIWASKSKEERLSWGSKVYSNLGGYVGKGNPWTSEFISKRVRECWQDPTYRQTIMDKAINNPTRILNSRRSSAKRPTLPELFLGSYLENKFPGQWTYNGFGRSGVAIGTKIPDFIRLDSRKEVIEVFGSYWHIESEVEDIKSFYLKFGYLCMVVWDYQIPGDLDSVFTMDMT